MRDGSPVRPVGCDEQETVQPIRHGLIDLFSRAKRNQTVHSGNSYQTHSGATDQFFFSLFPFVAVHLGLTRDTVFFAAQQKERGATSLALLSCPFAPPPPTKRGNASRGIISVTAVAY